MEDNSIKGLEMFIKGFCGIIGIVSAMLAVYSLIWGEWQTLRLCLTILVTYGFYFGLREFYFYLKGRTK